LSGTAAELAILRDDLSTGENRAGVAGELKK
jgi:hypothetical protein